jgi:hypothetical protein
MCSRLFPRTIFSLLVFDVILLIGIAGDGSLLDMLKNFFSVIGEPYSS